MKFEWNRRASTVAAYAFIVLALAILFFNLVANFNAVSAWLSALLRPILPIFTGFALAYLLNPVMVWVEALIMRIPFVAKMRRRRRRALSVLLTYLLAAAVITMFLFIVLPQVVDSVSKMVSQIQVYANSAEAFISGLLESIPEGLVPEEYIEQLSDMFGQWVSQLISWVGTSAPKLVGIAVDLGNTVIAAVVGVIVSVYLLYSKEMFLAQLRKALVAFLPRRRLAALTQVAQTADSMFGRFITGKIIDSLIIGILCFICLSVMKMPNTILVSFIVGVTNIIPYFGPFLGAVPSFFIIAINPNQENALLQGFVFLVFILVLQQIDGNIIGPKILGDSTGLPAFWVVFAILFFGGAFGIFGMFIGVPTFGVIYWLIKEKILAQLTHKGLPTETNEYMQPLNEGRPQTVANPTVQDLKDEEPK